ncbi:hypothetical protein OIDMADRAFT_20645 [Oidiodendron maius Zn]|uniref:Uncharacterized protein n=1 Tax=Oidiodendron maius (strain Zn) TaxID=913774 RepID=A0A0C3GL02_OIDMZ|nr:hypothetical protein OIDMADRAFT_20645 [Oidiodendron maius Zn]
MKTTSAILSVLLALSTAVLSAPNPNTPEMYGWDPVKEKRCCPDEVCGITCHTFCC